LFLNEKGFITESAGANLFFIRKDQLITPSAETGCMTDIMRAYVLQSAAQAGFRITETASLAVAELPQMEEIFTVSEENGFRWILGIGGKRYLKTSTEVIWRQVNIRSFREKM
jgi:branched-subunit amino acid aminotransferase/4-amino-4-deoxychorismate lyase